MPPRDHSDLGASAAERWMNCPPSALLTRGMKDEETIYAAEGSAAHALCEWKVRRLLKQEAGRRPCSDYQSDEMEACSDDYRDYVADILGRAQQHCDDPVALVEQHVDYSCYVPDGYGTADLILIADEELNVVDFKYGRGIPVHAEHNVQMMLYALGALILFDMLYDIDTVTMTIFQPRIDNISVWTIKAEQLYQWAEKELRPKAEMAAKGEGEFTPGTWCRFCKARSQCRARAESYLEMARMDFRPPALLSDDEIAEVMDRADDLRRWVEDVMTYASAQAIENGRHFDGWKVVEGRTNRKFTDTTAVEEAAKTAGFKDIYNKTLISLTAFEKLMGKAKFQEILGQYVYKPAGKRTLVRDTDPRKELETVNVDRDFTSI